MGASKCQSTQGTPAPTDCKNVADISAGEVCTIETAKEYGIFGGTDYFQEIDANDATSIDTLKDNVNNMSKQFSLCSLKTNLDGSRAAIKNCVLSTGNPWKTLDDTAQHCMLPLKIELPSILKFKEGSESIIEKPFNIKQWKNKNEYCQEKWYDWYSIPDYHFGNAYNLSSNMKNCLQPCSIGSVPHLTEKDKCVSKNDFQGGEFAGTFPYLPLSLIMLLGNTKSTLLSKYDTMMDEANSNMIKNGSVFVNVDVFSNLMEDTKTRDNIYNEIKADLSYHINNLVSLPYDDRHIMPPTFDDSKLIVNPVTKMRIAEAYAIADNFYKTCPDSKTPECIALKAAMADVSGLDPNSSKFHKQLLTLKKACNVAFNGVSFYSNNVIMQNLDVEYKKPINFDISPSDRLMALSENPSENAITVDEGTSQQAKQLLSSQRRASAAVVDNDKMDLKKMDYDPHKYDENKYVDDGVTESKGFVSAKGLIMTTVFIILFILFAGVLYLIISAFWGPFADMLNTLILATYYAIFKLKDAMFRGKYDPPSLNKDIIQLQINYLDKKINQDLKKFKLDASKLGLTGRK
jgi:hypothetical protein